MILPVKSKLGKVRKAVANAGRQPLATGNEVDIKGS